MVLLFSWSMLMPNTLDVLFEFVAMVSRNMMYRCSKATKIAKTVVSVLIFKLSLLFFAKGWNYIHRLLFMVSTIMMVARF
jgi:hypothetical protein